MFFVCFQVKFWPCLTACSFRKSFILIPVSWAESLSSWQWGSKTGKGLGFKFSYCQYFRCHGATCHWSSVCASLLELHAAYCFFYHAELCFLVLHRLLPQCVKYRPIVPDPEQLIGRRDPVRVGVLGIPKDGVGQPDQTNHIADWMRDKETERQREREREEAMVAAEFLQISHKRKRQILYPIRG